MSSPIKFLAMSRAALPFCAPRAVSQHAGSRANASRPQQCSSRADHTPRSLARRGQRAQLQWIRTLVFALRSAPSRTSSATVAVWPWEAASMSAVQPSCSTRSVRGKPR
jgi:hypothetical protein